MTCYKTDHGEYSTVVEINSLTVVLILEVIQLTYHRLKPFFLRLKSINL